MLRITLIGGLWWGRRYRFIVHRWRRSTGRVAGQGLSLPIHRICFFFFPPVVHFSSGVALFFSFRFFFLSFFRFFVRSLFLCGQVAAAIPKLATAARLFRSCHFRIRSCFHSIDFLIPAGNFQLFHVSIISYRLLPSFFFLLGFHELIESLCFFRFSIRFHGFLPSFTEFHGFEVGSFGFYEVSRVLPSFTGFYLVAMISFELLPSFT